MGNTTIEQTRDRHGPDPVTVWFHQFQAHPTARYGVYVCGRTFLRDDTSRQMARASYWAILRCRWLCQRRRKMARADSYSRYIDWHLQCPRCGCHYLYLTPNSPQVTGPWTRDRSRPRHHFPGMFGTWRGRLATWLRMVRHNWIGW